MPPETEDAIAPTDSRLSVRRCSSFQAEGRMPFTCRPARLPLRIILFVPYDDSEDLTQPALLSRRSDIFGGHHRESVFPMPLFPSRTSLTALNSDMRMSFCHVEAAFNFLSLFCAGRNDTQMMSGG
jgi:hypothetical protein